MKVLVVDASQEDRGRVSDALSELTNFVIQGAAANLSGGLRTLEDCAPDIVVTDVKFPDGDGVGLIHAARRHHAAPAVVVYTAADSAEQRKRSLEAGADLYLVKGGGLHELQSGVREVTIARRSSRRAGTGAPADRFAILGRIAGGVAHDLNNYFAVMSMSMTTLEAVQDIRLREEVEQAREALRLATKLTRNLLEYARGGAPAPAPVDLVALVQRTLDLVSRVLPAEVGVAVEADADLPEVRGVACELEQLVLNLVLNACDAMPGGGELLLSLRAAGDSAVTLEVADTGSGLAAAAAASHGATSPSSKNGRTGEGLGLGIVRAVVDRHGAALRIGPREGGGTRVVVVFFTR